MLVVGADGCRGGWVAVAYDTARPELVVRVHPTLRVLLAAYPDAAMIAVDIPIGLATGAPRPCDMAAKTGLGSRGASVFPAPDRRLIKVLSFDEKADGRLAHALTHSQTTALAVKITGKGISQQTYYICPKIEEADRLMTPELQRRVIEVHPEVSFWALAGRCPMQHPKRTSAGYEERRTLLATAFGGITIPDRRAAGRLARPAGANDVLDAIAAAWTARRHAEGRTGRFPVEPARDERGLTMQIMY